jgi:carboxylesterase type B
MLKRLSTVYLYDTYFLIFFVYFKAGDMTCLLNVSAEDIALAEHEARSVVTSPFLLELFEPIGPGVDGDEVKMEPVNAAQSGKFENIPLLIGTVSEETRIFVYEAFKKTMGLETYLGLLILADPMKALKLLDKYPPVKSSDCRDTLQNLSTDLIFTCTARNVSRSLQTFGHSSIHLYIFNHPFSAKGAWYNFTFCEGHDCHGVELPFVFHTAHLGGFHLSPEEERLSTELISYWSNFAYTSNPNTGPHPVYLNWPNYYIKQTTIMHFKTPESELLDEYRKNFCDFWDDVGYFI